MPHATACLPVPGSIKYLRKKQELIDKGFQDFLPEGLEDGGYDHPVLVLSKAENGDDRVKFLQMTSFGGRTLGQKFPNQLHQARAWHLPVHPADPHPDSGKLLYLDGSRKMKKNSYDKTNEIKKVAAKLLVTCDKDPALALSQASYEIVCDLAGYNIMPPVEHSRAPSVDVERGLPSAPAARTIPQPHVPTRMNVPVHALDSHRQYVPPQRPARPNYSTFPRSSGPREESPKLPEPPSIWSKILGGLWKSAGVLGKGLGGGLAGAAEFCWRQSGTISLLVVCLLLAYGAFLGVKWVGHLIYLAAKAVRDGFVKSWGLVKDWLAGLFGNGTSIWGRSMLGTRAG